MPGGIFISYRRDDSRHAAARLFYHLRMTYTPDQLFMDVDNIPPGIDFEKMLADQVAACAVMLVVIGSNWIDARDDTGARRLDNPRDFVRLEVEAALSRNNVRVIPVLLDGAAAPHEAVLPVVLRPLAKRHAVRLTNDRFDSDADGLVRSLRNLVRPPGEKQSELSTTVRLGPKEKAGSTAGIATGFLLAAGSIGLSEVSVQHATSIYALERRNATLIAIGWFILFAWSATRAYQSRAWAIVSTASVVAGLLCGALAAYLFLDPFYWPHGGGLGSGLN